MPFIALRGDVTQLLFVLAVAGNVAWTTKSSVLSQSTFLITVTGSPVQVGLSEKKFALREMDGAAGFRPP